MNLIQPLPCSSCSGCTKKKRFKFGIKFHSTTEHDAHLVLFVVVLVVVVLVDVVVDVEVVVLREKIQIFVST